MVRLERSGLELSRFGLGTAPLGGLFAPVPAEEAHAVVQRCLAAGVRLFDTAPLYGYGSAEERLGEGLQGAPRSAFVLSSKVGRLMRPSGTPEFADDFFQSALPLEPVRDLTRDGVLRSIEESLERLDLDRLDIVHLHDVEEFFAEAAGTAYAALDELRSEGTIGAVGVGVNEADVAARFVEACDLDVIIAAGRYTLLDTSALDELLPLCERRGTRLIAAGVFNSGVLADPKPGAPYFYVAADDAVVDRALRLRATCERHGVPLTAAALQFPLAHPAVCSEIIGCRSVAEVDANLADLARPLPDALWQELRADGLLDERAPVPAEPAASSS